jgi:hypothetical protein
LNRDPKLFIRSRGIRFRINSKAWVEWLKIKGVPAGRAKSRTAIPDLIFADQRLLKSCIRGVFDTDGSVYFDRRPMYTKPYPRIELYMKNTRLLDQVADYLNSIGIRCSLIRSKNAIETSGIGTLKLFL